RNLVYRDPLFEVMVICWRPGQGTPIHTHNGQLGWMLVERGGIEVTNYRYLSGNAPQNQNGVGIDCLGGATKVDPETPTHEEGAGVGAGKRPEPPPRPRAPAAAAERGGALHISRVLSAWSTPSNRERGRFSRRSLFWDSKYAQAVEETSPAPPSSPASLPLA